MQPVVAKLGGNALGSLPDALALGAGGRQLVIVHGGGAQISALMRRRGIEPRFVGGRRFTDLPSLACVRKALGDVSDELMAAIAAAGGTAVPMRLGEALVGERLPELGLVGRIAHVDDAPLRAAWAAGGVPLIAPLARDGAGERYLNVNADDVAAAVAGRARQRTSSCSCPTCRACWPRTARVIAEISASAPPAVDRRDAAEARGLRRGRRRRRRPRRDRRRHAW